MFEKIASKNPRKVTNYSVHSSKDWKLVSQLARVGQASKVTNILRRASDGLHISSCLFIVVIFV